MMKRFLSKAGTGSFVAQVRTRFFLRVLFLCAVLCAFYSLPAGAAGEVDGAVRDISVRGLSSLGREELLGLLDIRAGETLEPLKVRAGIRRVFLKGIFEDVEVYAEEGRTKVEVVVREKDRIRKVLVTDTSHFPDREIRALFSLQEGQTVRDDLVDDAVKHLKKALAERGFPDAAVSVELASSAKPYAKDLTISVREGMPVLVEKIIVQGAPGDEVTGAMRIGQGDIYDQPALQKDVERIKAYYKKRGYLNPLVTCSFSEGTLTIEVGKGKRLVLGFEGNTVFNNGRLTREMPFASAGEVRDDLVEDATRRVVSLYFGKGYAHVQAAPLRSAADSETTELTFFIFEGQRITVGTLTLPGTTLQEKNLKEVLPLKEGDDYNPELLSSDADVVREFYIALGYLGVEVGTPDVTMEGDRAILSIAVKEGLQTRIDKVEIANARSIPEEEIRKAIGLHLGAPYNEVDIADARLRVTDIYQERGFLDVAVHARADLSGEKARITFEIEEGGKTFFGKTIITGNTRTRREVVERELLHKESAPFSYSLLAKERQKLYKIGLFTDVRIEPLDQYDHRRDIRINVTEADAGSVEFGFGYSNLDKFTGFVDIGYRNLFGMNRQLSLRIGKNALENLVALSYLDPWFLETPLQFKGTLFYNEKDEKNFDTKVVMYRYKRQGVSFGIEKQYTPTTRGELYYEFVLADTTNVQPDIVLTDKDSGRLVISSIRPGITYDTRDNPFDPRNGVLLGLTMKVASPALLSEAHFVKFIFNGSLYHELSKHFVFAAALRSGVARAWGSSDILPLAERFFLGGRNTVRGYAQDTLGPRGFENNPTGGNAFIGTNVELRASITKSIGLVTFFDSGNVWQKVGDVDWTLKHAVGAGVRYNTPVGPLRLDYGYKLKKEEGLSRSEIFFSIGQAF